MMTLQVVAAQAKERYAMIFMCIMDYGPPAEMAKVRPEHRAYMFDLIGDGKALAAGSFLPDSDGGLFLYEASDLDEARKLVEEDPYVLQGVVHNYMLREYEVHGANADLLRVTG